MFQYCHSILYRGKTAGREIVHRPAVFAMANTYRLRAYFTSKDRLGLVAQRRSYTQQTLLIRVSLVEEKATALFFRAAILIARGIYAIMKS